MKKIILGIMLVLLVSCAQQKFVCPDGSLVDDPTTCSEEVREEAEETIEKEASEEKTTEDDGINGFAEEVRGFQKDEKKEPLTDETVKGIITKALQKTKSFKFVYVGPPENLPRDTYFVKGDKAKVEILKATDNKLSQRFTTVYLDLKKETAFAVCESEDMSRCPDGYVEFGEVEFDEYYVKTPLQWLNDIETASYAGNGPKFESRPTMRIDFTTADVSGEMHVLEFDALPGRVILDDGAEIEFRDLSINTVKDEEVTNG